jgi:chorismate mutase
MTRDTQDRDPLAELAACRSEIEAIDLRLVALLAERVTLARRTAALKRAADLPILDSRREAEVIRHAVTSAVEHGLPEAPVRDLYHQIVLLSRRAQEASS